MPIGAVCVVRFGVSTPVVTVESMWPLLLGAVVLAGVGVALTRRRILLIRWCVWAVAVPAVVGLFWWGPPGITILAMTAGVIGAIEFGALMGVPALDRVVLAAGVAAVVLTAWLAPEFVWQVAGTATLAVTAVPVVAGDAPYGLHRLCSGILGVVWLSLLAAMVPLGDVALALFAAVSLGDVVAFFTGPRLGGPRLSPLSPGKRWSGTVAGASAGIAVAALLGALSWPMVFAVAIGAPAGDLLESMIKRGMQSKDSGRWLAGAGGLLDRIDSYLLALGVLLLLQ